MRVAATCLADAAARLTGTGCWVLKRKKPVLAGLARTRCNLVTGQQPHVLMPG